MSTKGVTRGFPLPSLREIREEKGYSRKELARMTGINYTTLWELESKGGGASFATLQKLESALRVNELTLRGIQNG